MTKNNNIKLEEIPKCSLKETLENVGGMWMYADRECLECDGYNIKCPNYEVIK